MTEHLLADVRLRVRVVAAAPQLPATEETFTATDREGYHDAVADLQLALVDVRDDLFDDANRLVTENVARLHEGNKAVDEVQIRPADAGRRHADDRVPAVEDLRIGHVFDRNLVRGT